MKFRNYCIVIVGNTKAVYPEIDKISENKPNFLDGKGMIISTFTSFMEPNELTDYFKLNNRNFLLFDLNKENSGFYITKPDIHEALFGFLETNTEDVLKLKAEDFLNVMEIETSVVDESSPSVKYSIKISDIKNMTMSEKEEMFNNFIDSGVDNWSDYDKKIVELLIK
jgi:hypothetical protein